MTYKVLTGDILKVPHRSRIILASVDPNLCLDDPIPPTEQNDTTFATHAQDFIGRTYLDQPLEDGTCSSH